MKLLQTLLTIGLALTFASSAFAAGRHCSARFEVKPAASGYARLPMDKFTGEGRCGSSVPNRCRDRARDAIFICMKHTVDEPFADKPVECNYKYKSDRWVENDYPIYGSRTFYSYLRNFVCSKYSNFNGGNVYVYGKSWGDKKCGRNEYLDTIRVHSCP